MAEKVMVYVLSCGQGMANWIEYYEDANDTLPSGLGLVDLGGNGTGRSAAVDYIVGRLEEMNDDGLSTRIDAVVISHQDSDHWNLIPHLFDQVGKKKITLTTGDVWKGGQQWGVRASTVVDRLGAISTDKKVRSFPADDCDYRGKSTTRIWKWGDDVRLRTLAANVTLTSTSPDMVRNGSSAVVAVELGKFAIILPGDATWETMMFVNTRVYGAKSQGKPGTCIAMSVPHHGALRTAVEGYGPQKTYDEMNTAVVQAFANNVGSKTVIASAGFQNTHHHPMTEIMEEFSVKVGTNKNNKHPWMGFDFTNNRWQDFKLVEKNLFTTVTNITKPPAFYNGIYTLTATGQATFDLEEFRPAVMSRQVIYHADLHDAPPEAGEPGAAEPGGGA